MSDDKFEGIRRALTLAMLTGQSVNVGLIRGGEAVKIEGIILKVFESRFRIQLELDEVSGHSDPLVETVGISEVEYVEYS